MKRRHWGVGAGSVGVAIALGVSCGSGGGGGEVVDNKAVLTSTSLNVSSIALRSNKKLALAGEVAECDASSLRCTPGNVSGDLCYAILGLGALGGDFFSMTWLAPDSTFPDGPESGTCSSAAFDLSASTEVSGKIKIPSSEGDMPSSKKIIRAELMYNYVDTTFKLTGTSGGTADGEYVVRTVYSTSATADDVTGTMVKGDKLIRLSTDSKFKWCNASGCSETRTEVESGIIQDTTVTGYEYPGDGNPDYVNVTANFPTPVSVEYSELSDTTKTWTLDFSVTDGIVWASEPSGFADAQSVVSAFRLKFGPNQSTTQGEDDDGIRASLTIQ